MNLPEALVALGSGKTIRHETWDCGVWVRVTINGWEWYNGSHKPLSTDYLRGWEIFETPPKSAEEVLQDLLYILQGYERKDDHK